MNWSSLRTISKNKRSGEVKQRQKHLGQFYTPPEVARTLVNWLTLKRPKRILDPACGTGEFLSLHRQSVGVEVDPVNAAAARQRAPGALIHSGDFFSWAVKTTERFEAAVGNPPFIRYQLFAGEIRELALQIASRLGAQFNALSSSWAPFLVATAGLLKPRGAMAFVVPAEIGHATYSKVLLNWLCQNFGSVGVVAIREKLFPELSEDAWLLYCGDFGGRTEAIGLSAAERFVEATTLPKFERSITLSQWKDVGWRLRPFLLPPRALSLYTELSNRPGVSHFSDVAHAGIGYVTGANDFFHLRPSEARLWELPRRCLKVAVRRAEQLPEKDVDTTTVRQWLDSDEPVLLIDLNGEAELPESARRYLATSDGARARQAYKCRNRDPWYAVPDVRVPDAFLSYMSGIRPSLVANSARCVCTNSVHAVRLKGRATISQLQKAWDHPLSRLSCEIEGHPLGGGMLKLEPGEAAKTRVPLRDLELTDGELGEVIEATNLLRRWRHYG